jgi:competence protein ComEA
MEAPECSLARPSRAAWVVGLALLLGALWARSPALSDCPMPSSAASREGRTVAVRCGPPRAAPLEGPARLLFAQGLDPNTADAETLAVLPGLGLAKAEAIVRARLQGPFERAEDLQRVPGIGPSTRDRLRPWLVFPRMSEAPAGPVDPAGHGK